MAEHPRVVGLDRTVWDIVCRIPRQVANNVLRHNGLAETGVQFVEDGRLGLDLVRQFARHGDQRWCPGGPVSNALYTMALRQWPGSQSVEVVWSGTVGFSDPSCEPLESPLDSLRRVGITILSTGRSNRHARAICVMDEHTASTRAILVETRRIDGSIPISWSPSDVVLLTLRDLLNATSLLREQLESAPGIAVLLGDRPPLDTDGFQTLVALAKFGKLRWLFGQLREFSDQSLLVGESPVDELANVEYVATSSDRPVMVWSGETRRALWLDVPLVRVSGDDLGAGDAYAGAYLHARLVGGSVSAAHDAGLEQSRIVLGVHGARVAPSDDLNAAFAETIDRWSSCHDEGRLFGRVRRAAGLVVISGGQTGIDQLGLSVAEQLGLPAFCILPRGRRTEFTDNPRDSGPGVSDGFGDSCVIELGTPSYRYRTWTTAYLGDGTLLWDHHDSEGSKETRKACRALGRPWLDITNLDAQGMWDNVGDWMVRHAIRVVNIAGNRESLLTAHQKQLAQAQMLRILRGSAFRGGGSRSGSWTGLSAGLVHGGGELAIGIVNTPTHRGLIGAFLREAYGLKMPTGRELVLHFPDHHLFLVMARPRDLPSLLRERAVDLILVGSDLLLPLASADMRIVLDTHLFPLLIVLVGRPDRIPPGGLPAGLRGLRIGSQDVLLAQHVLKDWEHLGKIRSIHGTAESWIRRGVLDAAVDTWHTGATAEANGLGLLCVFGETSLVAAVRGRGSATLGPAANEFLRRLASWLADIKPA